MHVVGARFRDLDSAIAALGAIQARAVVAPGDAAVRPLGSTRYETPARGFLLAGRFAPGDLEAVLEIVRRHGGVVLERRVEWRDAGIAKGGNGKPAPSWEARGRPSERGPTTRGKVVHAGHRPPRTRLRRPATGLRRTARDRRLSG
jgi:hypothetical protein